MLIGTLYALAAGLMWGLVFVAPLLLPEYPAALLSFGRYLAFGLIALPLAWWDRERLSRLQRADWLEAMKLSLVGNIIYYLGLAGALQRAGGPLPTMIIGTLPVVIALCSNGRNVERDGRLGWSRLGPSLLLIGAGIALVNHVEMAYLRSDPNADLWRYAQGAGLALVALACWTWYPMRNADWLRAHADRSPTTWATAQGLVTLPLALVGYLGWTAWSAASGTGFALPLGPRPLAFASLMFTIGLFASWLGTLCWNHASQRLPTHLVGQLIVFETLAALGYALALRGERPPLLVLAGVALLVAGVVWALHAKPSRATGAAPAGPRRPSQAVRVE